MMMLSSLVKKTLKTLLLILKRNITAELFFFITDNKSEIEREGESSELV